MQVIRKIVNADVLSPIINLPWKSDDMKVEVIIIPLMEEESQGTIDFRKLKGCLKEYANPALWEKESTAWENHIIEKYGTV